MQVKDYPNVHAMLKETVDRYSEHTAYKWFVDGGRTESATWKQFDEFLELGKDLSDEAFYERVDAVIPQDTAGIVYTSGTTEVPQGAVLTHDNITFTAQSVRESTDIRNGDEVFIFLPLAHVFARTCVSATLLTGRPTTFTRSMATVIDDIKVARPHWFASVPRIYEKVYSAHR